MRRIEIEVLQELRTKPHSISELAERLDKNQGWISEVVSELADKHLVEKDGQIAYADTFTARLQNSLSERYNLKELLVGKKEGILRELHRESQTVSELEKQGFASSTVYSALDDLQTLGVVTKQDDGRYRVTDETLQQYLTASNTEGTHGGKYVAEEGKIVVGSRGDEADGEPTAFSAFERYGVEYYPAQAYRYQNDSSPGIEEVLIHAVKTAENRKQATMAVVFYLKHRSILESSELWKLANKWDCVEEWADTLAYADQRDPKHGDRFLSWDEFTSLAQDYDVFRRGYHPEERLQEGLEQLGEALDTEVDAYLLGGGNLILRGLKDSTKDLDIVVDERQSFLELGEALREIGYEERTDLEEAYQELDPAIVFEKEGSPRYDIFVEAVAGKLQLTKEMMDRVDQSFEYGNLRMHLLSLTDIFLFKSITEREGDLEDTALITRQASLDWKAMLKEIKKQDKIAGQYFSFAVLDTIDILKQRENIDPPIHQKLVSYCLEKALLVSLEEPKTIKDLRDELDFPDHRIYNKLRKLEEEGRIEVDRGGTLNTYAIK
ncbi:transcriptional regulator [Halapricum desulfuricans]|uniref:Transcriptional regulator, contains HTH domain n=1 Tax=Halapricum desulfuricans TaxID=2841257 RepID=A0A897NUC9_9EURY|nr:transcriptional regulator [Halapricum desulfuricans]QSG13766.1 Transcriptional regulator, contains HTH domain [Halapricum desulfuricans]